MCPIKKPKWPHSLSELHQASKAKYRSWVAHERSYDPADPYKVAYEEAKGAFRRTFRAYQRVSLAEFYDSLDPSSGLWCTSSPHHASIYTGSQILRLLYYQWLGKIFW